MSVLTLVIVSFIMAILVLTMWYLSVVLVGISLMTTDVDHHCMCLMDICLSSLVKCLFKLFAYFYLLVLYLFTYLFLLILPIFKIGLFVFI